METIVLVFILFVELVIAGILINVNTGQADKSITVYDSWDSKIEYADRYATNAYFRYNGITMDYFEVCALIGSSYGQDDCVIEYPANDFMTNKDKYISKEYLCDVVIEEYGLHRTMVTFKEVQ